MFLCLSINKMSRKYDARWTGAECHLLVNLRSEGYFWSEISERTHIPASSCFRKFRRITKPDYLPGLRRWTPAAEQLLRGQEGVNLQVNEKVCHEHLLRYKARHPTFHKGMANDGNIHLTHHFPQRHHQEFPGFDPSKRKPLYLSRYQQKLPEVHLPQLSLFNISEICYRKERPRFHIHEPLDWQP